jgi:hypothetical protein
MIELSLLLLEVLRLMVGEGTAWTPKKITSNTAIRVSSLFIDSIFVLVAKVKINLNDFSFSTVLFKANKVGKPEKTNR